MTATFALTDAQVNTLALIERARVEDVAVTVAGRTQWGPEPTVRRSIAIKLVRFGHVRFSRPMGRYVLITESGRALLGAARETAAS